MMKQAIVLLVVMGLLIAGCKGGAQEGPGESPVPSSTVEVTAGPQEPSAAAMPSEEGPVEPVGGSSAVDTIVILVPRPVETLEPYMMTTPNPEDSVAAHIWDTLTWIDDDLGLQPHLAESWRLVNDTTWEFRLRSGVVFHNGEPFDAAAAKFSIERTAQLEGGVETFVADVGLRRVEIVDEYTVQLMMDAPHVSVPYELASVEMLPPSYYASGTGDLAPVGSGPYRFLRQEDDGSVVLEANPDYWQGPPVLPKLVFRPEADPLTRLTRLLDGDAHLILDVSPDQIAILETDDTRVEAVESTRRLFIGMRVESDSPLDDVRVRQALNYAVDVDAVVDSLAGGYGERYGSWVNPPHSLTTLAPWPYDPDKARQLLAEAGYPEGFPTSLDTPVGRYDQDEAIAYAIAEQLSEVGIEVQVRPYEWGGYVRDRLIPKETAPLFLLGIASRGNGLEDTANLAVDFPFNPTLWHDDEFEELVAQARTTFNRDQRQALLNQAQAIAYEEAPWIWLWRPYAFYGVASWLDWKPRADGLIYLYKANPAD